MPNIGREKMKIIDVLRRYDRGPRGWWIVLLGLALAAPSLHCDGAGRVGDEGRDRAAATGLSAGIQRGPGSGEGRWRSDSTTDELILATPEGAVPDRPDEHRGNFDALPDIDEFVPVDEEPTWDQAALQRRIRLPKKIFPAPTGSRVVTRVLVDRQGKVVRTHIDESAGPLLDSAVVRAIRRTRFTPAIAGGRPIACWVAIPVIVELR
jgi:TonB family protein